MLKLQKDAPDDILLIYYISTPDHLSFIQVESLVMTTELKQNF